MIHIDGDTLVATLDAHGWVQGSWEADDGRICAHQCIRLCQPVPGDAFLVEQVEAGRGRGTAWNDDDETTEADVRAWLAAGIDVTDDALAATFGPQWRAAVALIRRAALLTSGEVNRLAAARDAAGDAAWYAARGAAGDAAWDAARSAAREAAGEAARGAAWDAARSVARGVARAAAGDAARGAAWGAVTWDLATEDGPYTVAQRDLLMAPWREVCGLPEGLVT